MDVTDDVFFQVSKFFLKEMMEMIKYPKGEFTILWQPKLCIHSGVCVKTLPKVYDPHRRPWIQVEHATVQELIDQVSGCPSGALTIEHYGTTNKGKL